MNDAVYVYKHTHDNGQELKHSLRSLYNINGFSGKVYVIGDREAWFSSKINHIQTRQHPNRYIDVLNKVARACQTDDISDEFIIMNDDMYITKQAPLRALYREVPPRIASFYNRCVHKSLDWCREYEDDPKNYELHLPMILNKSKMLTVYNLIKNDMHPVPILYRTAYGNFYHIGGHPYKDAKAYDLNLEDKVFISTSTFTPELEFLFPKKSIYEQ